VSPRPLRLPLGDGRAIRIGYRTPMLKKELDARGRIALARDLGIEVIETQINADRDIGSVEEARELKLAADAAGVEIGSTGCNLPLTSGGDAEFTRQLDFVMTIVEALGVRMALCGVPLPPEGAPQAETWALASRRLRQVCERFGAGGRRFGIEPDHGTFLHTAERLARMVALVDHPACLANFDACNLYVGGSDPVAALELLRGRIASGHVKDGVFRTEKRGETPLGQGEVPWVEILRAMARAGLACPMYIEHYTTAASVTAAAAHMRTVLDRVGGVAAAKA
jgi:sugar phosphate isomerase/epimerase